MRAAAFTSLLLSLGTALTAPTARWSTDVPSGFVTTNGTSFQLDGQPFAFVGTNSFWLPLLSNDDDVHATFEAIAAAGIKVVRTWGFNAINETELPYADSINLTYYQVWNSSGWTLNEGSQGLQRLDYVLYAAAIHDIRLIITFTNNWIGYGGADLYVNWLAGAGATHDVFYTDPTIIASYQQYVQTIVNRYKDSPTVFAWELMNEARCASDLLTASAACHPGSGTLGLWYQQQSDFVRSIDPYHMITTGGEGQFYWAQPDTYWYNNTLVTDFNFDGAAGEDFEWDLGLPNIDFGVYHMYVQTWYPELDYPGSNFSIEDWGLDWIEAHALTAQMVGKPIVIEEFGLTGLDNKTAIYPTWVQRTLGSNHAGVMFWQWGQLNLTEGGGNQPFKYTDAIVNGASPNDGFTVYTNQTTVMDIFTQAAVIQAQRSA